MTIQYESSMSHFFLVIVLVWFYCVSFSITWYFTKNWALSKILLVRHCPCTKNNNRSMIYFWPFRSSDYTCSENFNGIDNFSDLCKQRYWVENGNYQEILKRLYKRGVLEFTRMKRMEDKLGKGNNIKSQRSMVFSRWSEKFSMVGVKM